MKVLKINSLFSKFLCLLVLVISLKCKNVSASNFNFFDFEQIKSDLFIPTTHNDSNGEPCSTELEAISTGILKSEEWALKLLDAWGKMPAGIFSGNFHAFGAFSQCFHIERHKVTYDTKYCLGHLTFAVEDSFLAHEPQKHSKHNVNVPNILSARNKQTTVPQFNGGLGFSIGICVPAVCSPESLVPIINKHIKKHVKTNNVSFSISDNNCQFKESPSEFATLDKVAIIFFGVVFVLIVASTGYDILCVVNNRQKIQLFLAFSFYTNGKKLLSYEKAKSDDTLHCLHGIRVITTQWIVLGHSYLLYALLPIQNLAAIPELIEKYRSMLILSAPIAVDTFFVISGLLVSINMLKHLQQNRGKMNVALVYLHRYLRLTPLLAVTILFSTSVLQFFGNGPLWPDVVGYFAQQCKRNWWKTLLYIQNYASPDDICLGHSWYLAVDTQLYFIAPAIAYFIFLFKFKAVPVLFLFVAGCIGCTVATSELYELKSFLSPKKMEIAYFPTHIRYSSWLIGFIAGYFIFQRRNKEVNMSKIFNTFGWILSLITMFIVIFANYPLQQLNTTATPEEFAFYDAYSRVFWSIALCYIIFTCVHGHGGLINKFLSHPLWQPLSRLSYSIYLLHLVVMMITTASIKSPLHFSELNAYLTFIGNYVLTVFVSIVASLAFESPLIIVEKLLFVPTTNSEPTHTDQTHHENQYHVEISYEQIENIAD